MPQVRQGMPLQTLWKQEILPLDAFLSWILKSLISWLAFPWAWFGLQLNVA
jgi:hypothetical protein